MYPKLAPMTISFRLEGDSIDAMRLVSIARKYNLSLSSADIFQAPRLRDLATRAVTMVSSATVAVQPFSLLRSDGSLDDIQAQIAHLCGVSPEQVEDVLPCTQLQEGLIALTTRRDGDYIAHFTTFTKLLMWPASRKPGLLQQHCSDLFD